MIISVANDFSPFPAGRDDADGPFNGNKFRSELLAPKLKEAISSNAKLVIDLSGLLSCGSSFLESAFGGLIRDSGFDYATLSETLDYKTDMEFRERYVGYIKEYLQKADKAKA